MKQKLRWSIVAGALVGALALAGCSGGSSNESSGDNGSVEQVLNFGLGGETPVLKAGNDQGNLGMTLNALVHRGLVTYAAGGEIVPALASEFEQISPKEYRFKLREGAKFQDGTDVTIDSVRDTWAYFAQAEHGAPTFEAFANVASVEEGEQAGEILVTLVENNGVFLQYLADPNTPILPAVGLDPNADNNIGAGPFTVIDRQAGVGSTLERFEEFYDVENVSLEKVELKFYPDGAARTNALLSGDVDIMDYVPWENFDQISSAGGFTVDVQDGPGLHLMFNTTSEPWNDPKVREAAAHAINRESLVDSVFEGHGLGKYGIAVQQGGEYDIPEATEMYDYDPEKAKQLLAEAGYPDGFTTTLLNNSQYAFSVDTTVQLQADLEAVGITVELNTPDWPGTMEAMGKGDYGVAVGTMYSPVSDPIHVLPFVTGNSMYKSFGYDNPELNEALRSGVAAENDEAAMESYKRAFEIMKKDVPFALFVQRGQAFGYSDSVQGFSTLPGFAAFYSAYTVADVEMQ